jgi:zinc-binding alcohol dehydrogenase/oxidoreductase
MHALTLDTLGQPLQLKPQNLAELKEGYARIKIAAAALNRRDFWITQGQYPGIVTPIILGSDGSGVVESIQGEQNHWAGKEVIANPSLNWGDNPAYQDENFSILGLPENGTLASFVDVPLSNLFEKPSHLTFEQAAALPLAGVTAWRALVTRGRCQPGDTVLVSGIGGGVAIFAMQFAKSMGCTVVVTSSSQPKLNKALELGADHGVLYTEDNWRKGLAKSYPQGFDVIVDGAGGEGFGDLARLLANGGRLAFYGGTRGKWPGILPQHLFFKQVDIVASTMGSPQDFEAMVTHVTEHKIIPVVDSVVDFKDHAQAFAKLEESSQFGKIVLTP